MHSHLHTHLGRWLNLWLLGRCQPPRHNSVFKGENMYVFQPCWKHLGHKPSGPGREEVPGLGDIQHLSSKWSVNLSKILGPRTTSIRYFISSWGEMGTWSQHQVDLKKVKEYGFKRMEKEGAPWKSASKPSLAFSLLQPLLQSRHRLIWSQNERPEALPWLCLCPEFSSPYFLWATFKYPPRPGSLSFLPREFGSRAPCAPRAPWPPRGEPAVHLQFLRRGWET